MYYIHATGVLRRREKFFLQLLPALIVFIAFLGVTLVSWKSAKNIVADEQHKILAQKNDETAKYLQERMKAYEDILRGGAGLFRASEVVTRQEWHQYIATYQIAERYPGVQGVGYIQSVDSDQLADHISQMRQDSYPTYSPFPAGSSSIYAPVVYLEPENEKNNSTIGFDMFSNKTSRHAMEKSRDIDEVVISDIVTLVQDRNDFNKQSGFLMYLPLYAKDNQPQTIAQRREAIRGYIYAPFRSHDLISQAPTVQDKQYGFKIYTTEVADSKVVFETDNFARFSQNSVNRQATTELPLQGVSWKITGYISPQVVNASVRSRPDGVLWSGVIFSFFVAGFIYLLLGNRSRALAEKESVNIQSAKDELLALASHQLRTPATGVKQYIGMLREGFVGTFTPAQKKLLDKAYASNERQLGTINEMLFVARADAGQLQLDFKHFEFKQVLQDIVDEQLGEMKKKRLDHKVKIPKKALPVYADKQYLRMAVENVISNAVKYTKDGGRVDIELTASHGMVVLRISDTGVGVAEADYSMLFKKFSRIPNELTSQVSGSGIGLYLARQVVDAHKGEIQFKSTPSRGSKVTLRLPIIQE